MNFILSACAIVAALIALGDYRYIQKITERFRFELPVLETTLLNQVNKQINIRNKIIPGSFQGPPLVDRLSIVPGKNDRHMGLVLEMPLHDLPRSSEPRRIATMTVDVAVALWGRSIMLARPCLRHASHDMGPNIDQRAKDEVLRRAAKRVFQHNIIAVPEGMLDRAGKGKILIERPATRIRVQDGAVQLVFGLVNEFQRDARRWPDPVGGECAAA